MKIVIGLGNPGKEYEKTRHNLGFMFLEYLEKKYKFNINKKMDNSIIGETNLNGEKVILVKPQTFMNLSGNAVNSIINWYKVDLKDVLIVFDDIDIPFGDVKYKINGSGGTHNGMKNIVQILSTKDIQRIKIGMGNLKNEHQDLASFVLQKFNREEMSKLEEIFNKAEEKLMFFLDK